MDIKENLVSVIMPAYNCENYIYDAIKSVLTQKYSDLELIIIDDCSTDNTRKVIENLLYIDSRIKFFKNKKNMGVSYTRNKGISLSNGNWVAFLDSDDIWKETKLEKQIYYAYKNKVNFLFTGVSYIDENSNNYKGIFNIPEKVSYKELLKQNIISCSSVLVRKVCFTGIKMESDNIHEDFCAWLKILRIEDFAFGVNEPLLIYRISRNSKSGNKIKSLKMTYRTYRYIGINPVRACYFLFFNIVRNLKKYRNILNGFPREYFKLLKDKKRGE